MEVTNLGGYGYVSVSGKAALTFEILGASDKEKLMEERVMKEVLSKYPEFFNFQGYAVASYGDDNNLPYAVKRLVSSNPILPEIIKKQARFMYGQGPFLFVEEYDPDLGKKRIPIVDQKTKYKDVFSWLRSWKSLGMPQSFEEYSKQVIQEYYHTEGFWTKYRFNKSRRINGPMPVRGLELVPSQKCRFGKPGNINPSEVLSDKDLTAVIVGKWERPNQYDMVAYPRFNPSDPLANGVAINYTRDFGFGEDIYSFPSWFYGLKEWISGSNLNPKYINSYLKNSLNAKLHVIIPQRWFELKEDTLKSLCERNKLAKQNNEALITEYEGLKDIGTTFSYNMIQKLLDAKLRLITEVLSGSGENQGKLFVSRKFRVENAVEEWEIKEIPTKYKEFIESIISFEKQALKSITAGIGIDPAISNVGSEGLYTNSGSQVYYNYLVYMSTLNYAEEFCTADINLALRLNFPELEKDDVKLGFYRQVPQRLESTNPEQRPDNLVKNS